MTPIRFSRFAAVLAALTLTLALGFAGPAEAQNRTPFTVQDLVSLRSFSLQDVTSDGRWAVGTVGSREDRWDTDHRRQGDPTYVAPSVVEVMLLDTDSGAMRPILEGKVQARGLTWSPDGRTLAFFLLRDGIPSLHLWEREPERLREIEPRTAMPISTGSSILWLPDGSGLVIEFRAEDWHARASGLFRELTEGPIIVLDGSDDFLAWDALRNLGALTIPARVDLPGGAVTPLASDEGDHSALSLVGNGTGVAAVRRYPLKTVYTAQGGAEFDLAVLPLEGGDPDILREQGESRPSVTWNEEGTRFAWAARGDVFLAAPGAERDSIDLTSAWRAAQVDAGADTTGLRFSAQQFSPDGSQLLLQSTRGWWLQDVSGGDPTLIFPFEADEELRPQRSVTAWSPDGRSLYATTAERNRWERGLLRLAIETGQIDTLVLDSGLYSGWRLLGDSGDRFLYQHSDGDLPNEWYIADSGFMETRQLTEMNPWIHERTLTRSELVTYRDVDGKEQHGILYYPVNYEEGQRYPLVAEVYETFFNNGFNANMNMFANAGWFGFRPSVTLEEGFPGEGWLKGVTSGINALIDRGLVDPDRLGVQGGSYGGYATALLVTQTSRFASAINISGKVNMVSFYGDSPRLGVRNITAPERGQDRLGCSLWECRQKYLEHSAIMDADRITTPLMLITGELDHNVPARQSMEMFYAMRRLGKEVVWVNYANGGHSPPNTMSETEDYWARILGWHSRWFNAAGEEESVAATADGAGGN